MNNTAFKIPGVKPGSDDEKLFCAIGFIVVQWGHCEQCLDLMVASIYPCLDKNYEKKKRPKMLDVKIEKLKKWVEEVEWLSSIKDETTQVLNTFSKLANTRHDLIHGAIASMEMQEGAFELIKLEHINNEHHIKTSTLRDCDFQFLRRELLRLGEEAGRLSRQTWDIVQKHQQ